MPEKVSERAAMVRHMSPRLAPGRFVFRTIADDAEAASLLPLAQGMFREAEGLSLILPAQDDAQDAMRQITLDVNSSLEGVGLTAAVLAALAAHGIACNVVAAYHHDHVFVPEKDAETALDVLINLARDGENKENSGA